MRHVRRVSSNVTRNGLHAPGLLEPPVPHVRIPRPRPLRRPLELVHHQRYRGGVVHPVRLDPPLRGRGGPQALPLLNAAAPLVRRVPRQLHPLLLLDLVLLVRHLDDDQAYTPHYTGGDQDEDACHVLQAEGVWRLLELLALLHVALEYPFVVEALHEAAFKELDLGGFVCRVMVGFWIEFL